MKIEVSVYVENDDGGRHEGQLSIDADSTETDFSPEVWLAQVATDVGADTTQLVRDLMDHPPHPEPVAPAGSRDWLN